MHEHDPFKTCTMCQNHWATQFHLATDKSLYLNGYQPDFREPEEGLLFLTHTVSDCHSTIAVEAKEFQRFYNGPIITKCNKGLEKCTGKCLNDKDLEPCQATCSMAWIREVMQFLRQHEIPPHLLSEWLELKQIFSEVK